MAAAESSHPKENWEKIPRICHLRELHLAFFTCSSYFCPDSMHILIAPNAFKNSLSAEAVSRAIQKVLLPADCISALQSFLSEMVEMVLLIFWVKALAQDQYILSQQIR